MPIHTIKRSCQRAYRLRSANIKRFSTAQVRDNDIARLAATPVHPLTLGDLVKYGPPPLSNSALYESANFALSILPTRLALRIQSLRNLPFIVLSNPNISKIHDNYMHSLSTLLPFAETKINSKDQELRFTEVMAGLVNTHANTIPVLARGFLESRKYISSADVTSFLDEHLRVRIGTRMIAEQHIALYYSSQQYQEDNQHHEPQEPEMSSYIGVIDTAMKPAQIVRNCEAFVSDICEFRYGVRPTVVINGEPEARIAQVPVHLEYILTELLKNAFRATIEKGNEREPIEVTIAPGLEQPITRSTASLADQPGRSTSGTGIKLWEKPTPGVTIRIRDHGGGIGPEHLKNIWNYSFTTFNENEATDSSGSGVSALNILSGNAASGSSLAGLGYGLPLSRAYAEYFGGGIEVQSLWGWGTDVYLSLRGVGKVE